jgi:hypothetical protein
VLPNRQFTKQPSRQTAFSPNSQLAQLETGKHLLTIS